jgi:predicted glycoside hydrolase/deacetylase ChbG (UPF0249 family)
MTGTRYLIVNADDFGQSHGVNAGIITAHEQGIVTSASLMVRWPAARAAADYARSNDRFAVGLHVDLGEWVCRVDEWIPVYEVVPRLDADAVQNEVQKQLAVFHDLLGRPPTHLDSHQHVHRFEPARSALLKAARELGIRVRHMDPHVHYCGAFYGLTSKGRPVPEAITAEALMSILSELTPGCTELACHPGVAGDLTSTYNAERSKEVAALCDVRVRQFIEKEKIRLIPAWPLPPRITD